MKAPLFYSKILLFGEYGIIKNSKGFAGRRVNINEEFLFEQVK